MINTLFKDIKNGRLLRLQYLGYSILICLIVIIFLASLVFAIGLGEHLLSGNFQEVQNQIQEWFTLPFLIIFVLFIVVLLFMSANIMSKRIRDIGLPGWWSILVIIIASMILSILVSEQASQVMHSVIWILLILVPTNALTKK